MSNRANSLMDLFSHNQLFTLVFTLMGLFSHTIWAHIRHITHRQLETHIFLLIHEKLTYALKKMLKKLKFLYIIFKYLGGFFFITWHLYVVTCTQLGSCLRNGWFHLPVKKIDLQFHQLEGTQSKVCILSSPKKITNYIYCGHTHTHKKRPTSNHLYRIIYRTVVLVKDVWIWLKIKSFSFLLNCKTIIKQYLSYNDPQK